MQTIMVQNAYTANPPIPILSINPDGEMNKATVSAMQINPEISTNIDPYTLTAFLILVYY
ncbi:hypothetical protein SAMN04487967_2230 [Natronorubrum sediminis]|uniref:Uncharacterized protein n=1 Tax=Natronorubrum sediminis TaxID=640943 RepID=A0A1H6G190_9EURY|nr:hypothetical protein SAMN04487967_2230 [Natronorubrum sediminis]